LGLGAVRTANNKVGGGNLHIVSLAIEIGVGPCLLLVDAENLGFIVKTEGVLL